MPVQHQGARRGWSRCPRPNRPGDGLAPIKLQLGQVQLKLEGFPRPEPWMMSFRSSRIWYPPSGYRPHTRIMVRRSIINKLGEMSNPFLRLTNIFFMLELPAEAKSGLTKKRMVDAMVEGIHPYVKDRLATEFIVGSGWTAGWPRPSPSPRPAGPEVHPSQAGQGQRKGVQSGTCVWLWGLASALYQRRVF